MTTMEPDGDRGGGRAPDVTAAIEVDPDALVPVSETENRERYAAEAERMHKRHDPDDSVGDGRVRWHAPRSLAPSGQSDEKTHTILYKYRN